jgi:hypothetical protein
MVIRSKKEVSSGTPTCTDIRTSGYESDEQNAREDVKAREARQGGTMMIRNKNEVYRKRERWLY